MGNIIIVEKRSDVASECKEIFLQEYEKQVINNATFNIAFSGGNTPKEFLKLLSKECINWSMVHIFLIDERYVPLEHEDSNYKLILNFLIKNIEIPKKNIHKIDFLENIESSRDEYKKEVQDFFDNNVLHMAFLGIGNDGHTASVFPENYEKINDSISVSEVDRVKHSRITMSIDFINKAKLKIFLLFENKRKILNNLNEKHPAYYIKKNVYYIINEVN